MEHSGQEIQRDGRFGYRISAITGRRLPSRQALWRKKVFYEGRLVEIERQMREWLVVPQDRPKRGEQSKVECPHCGVLGNAGPMARWHFENCRSPKRALGVGSESGDQGENNV